MSVEFSDGDGDYVRDGELDVERRRLLITQLARRTGITEPDKAVKAVEALLDGQTTEQELAGEHGWSREDLTLLSAIGRLYDYQESIQPAEDTRLSSNLGAESASSPEPSPHEKTGYPALRPEKATNGLAIPLQNLFGGILDNDQQIALLGLEPAKANLFIFEMGKIYVENSARPEFGAKQASRMKQFLEGRPTKEIAAADGVTAVGLTVAFQRNLPKIFLPHRERIVGQLARIEAIPSDSEELEAVDWDTLESMLHLQGAAKAAKRSADFAARPRKQYARAPRSSAVAGQEIRRAAPKRAVEKKPKPESDEAGDDDEKTTAKTDENFADLDSVGFYMKQTGNRALLTAVEEVELAKRIEAGLYAQHRLDWLQGGTSEALKKKHRHKMSTEERRDLMWVARDGEAAKNHMLEANTRLVVSLAKRYTGRGLDFQDLIQEGNLGLIRGMEKFDYTKGYKFSTYATWWIRQALTRGLHDQSRTIRIPVHVAEVVNKLDRIKRELVADLNRDPTIEEIAKEADLTPEKVLDIFENTRQTISLDQTVGTDEEAPLGDFIEDADAESAAETFENKDLSDAIERALQTLEPREADVMRRRTGLYDGDFWTLDQIAKSYGLTRERIRQIESKAKAKLRHPSNKETLGSYL